MTVRLGAVDGRPVLCSPEGSADVERASSGRFSSTIEILDAYDDFRSWAAGVTPDEPPVDASRLEPPVGQPRQVFAIGLNYRDHAVEAGYDTSGLPQVFTKFPSCLTGPVAAVEVNSPRLDWEVELVVVIGQDSHRVSEENAWSHVAGLMVGQDLSARDVQLAGSSPQWSLGKSFPGFGPVGPLLTDLSAVERPDDLALNCRLNGEVVQSDRTSRMIWSVPELIARLSSVVLLLPGDLIFTGTPAGVGNRRTPPHYLAPGDVLESEIDGLGSLTTSFVSGGTR